MPCLRSGQLSPSRCVAIFLAGLTALGASADAEAPKKLAPAQSAVSSHVASRAIPLVFEENAGQFPADTAFAGRTQEYTVQVRNSGLTFDLMGKHVERTVTLSFTGSHGAMPEAVSQAGFLTNIYEGSDPRSWHIGIRNYHRVALRKLYPGVDAEFYSRGNELEHDFMLAPEADASELSMHLAGAQTVTLAPSGDLVLAAEDGALRLHKPNAYQIGANGEHQPVAAQFELAKNGDSADVTFKLGAYDRSRGLVIDPVITYATYVGGDAAVTPVAIATDSASNVYLTGYTQSTESSFANVPATALQASGASTTTAPTSQTAFVAKFATNNGSQIAWLSYYGGGTGTGSGPVQPRAIALQGTGAVYIGGQTTSTNLSATAGTPIPALTTSIYGFFASFSASTGTLISGGYIPAVVSLSHTQSVTTGVTSLATDAASLYVGGFTDGTPAPSTDALVGALSATGSIEGYLAVYNATAAGGATAGPTYSSLVAGNITSATTTISSIAVDALKNVYFTGQTNGNFPKAATGAFGSGGYNTPSSAKAAVNCNPLPFGTAVAPSTAGCYVFASEITYTPAAGVTPAAYSTALPFSFWSGGTSSDVATALVRDTNGNIFVGGNTSSTDFVATASSTQTAPADTPALVQPYDARYTGPIGGAPQGFLAELDSSGDLLDATFINGLTTSSATSVSSLAADSTNAIYIAGATSAAKKNFPADTAGDGSASAPAPEVLAIPGIPDGTTAGGASEDASSGATRHGYVLKTQTVPGTSGQRSTQIVYRGYFGPATGTASSVGVAVDNATVVDSTGTATATPAPFAYVLSSEQPGATGSFTTAAAAQGLPYPSVPQTAYLAQVAFSTPGAAAQITYSPASSTISPNPVAYVSATARTNLTLTWTLTTGATAANEVVFNLPQSTYLDAYAAGDLTVTINGAAPATNPCALSAVSTYENPTPGFTCVFSQVAANASVVFSLTKFVTSAIPGNGSTFPVAAAAFDAAGDNYDMTQNVPVSGIPAFTFTVSASPTTVNAGNGQADSTLFAYTYTITNTNGIASASTVLTTNIDYTKFTPTSTTVTGTCTPGATTAQTVTTTTCNIPANGTVVYKVFGYITAGNFRNMGAGPYSVALTAAPVINFGPLVSFNGGANTTNSQTANPAPATVSVNGLAVITINALAPLAPTYPAATPTGFRLGDSSTGTASIGLKGSVTNAGPDDIGAYTFKVNLPQGFSPASSTGAACTFASLVATCTFSSVPGNNVAQAFTIAGSFPDTGLATDAVAPPATSPAPTAATVKASASFGSQPVTQVAPANGLISGSNVTSTVTASPNIVVTRVNTYGYTVAFATPLTGGTVNELSPAHSASSNDTLNFTVDVTNAGSSVGRGIYFVVPLPNPTRATITLAANAVTYYGGAAQTPVAVAAANQLTCSQVASLGGLVCYTDDLLAVPTTASTPPFPLKYEVKFTATYSEATIAQTVTSGTIALTENPGSLLAAADGLNTGSGMASTVNGAATATINVQRLSNLQQTTTFVRNGAAPAKFADTADMNLDEHTAALGVNDTLSVTASILNTSAGNTGVNDAAGVALQVSLPAFMEVFVPAGCTLNGGATLANGMVATGPSGLTMSCTTPALTAAVPSPASGTSVAGQLLLSSSGACSTAASTTAALSATKTSNSGWDNSCFTVAFYAKFVDSGDANTVVGTATTGTAAFNGVNPTDNDVHAGISSSVAPTSIKVQRAAHLYFSSFMAPTYTDNSALSVDPANVPELPQAAMRMDPATRLTTSGKVYDCVRYPIVYANEGPNYALGAVMSFAQSQSFNYISTSNGSGPSYGPVNCAPTAPSGVTGIGVLSASTFGTGIVGTVPYNGTGAVYIDGYFDTGILGTANSGPVTFQTGPLSNFGYNDSDKPKTAALDFQKAETDTLVNTPMNNSSTTGFGITAYGTTPQVNLIFSSVTKAGITGALAATLNCASVAGSTNTSNCYPYGKSPYPPDAGANRNLYQPGATPQYYAVPTTATAPAQAANSTSICITAAGGAFPDTFVKPERVLLWVLSNPLAGTTPNTFQSGSPALTSPLAGDVTTLVLPYQARTSDPAAYTVLPSKITFAQTPQAQPAAICGLVNGLTTTTNATSSTGAEVFGLLEPTNFPPYVVAGTVSTATTNSKGGTSNLDDVYLVEKASGQSTYTFDYNNQDPCYTGTGGLSRSYCDDNPYLYAQIFANIGNVPPVLVSSLGPENATNGSGTAAAPAGSLNVSSLNLSSSSTIFVTVTDQAVGADTANADIKSAPGYTSNPFQHQGNFLIANYSPSTSTAAPSTCDPGVSSAGYSPSLNPCSKNVQFGTTGGLYITGGAKTTTAANYAAVPDLAGGYYYLGNVGAQAVTGVSNTGGGGSGLTPLPLPTAPVTNPPQGGPAIVTITAGGTAAFVWSYLPNTGGTSGHVYTLTCAEYANLTDATTQSFPQGLSCTPTTTTPGNSNAAANAYTFGTSTAPTIFVSTTGGPYCVASNTNTKEPAWKRGMESLALAMLLPLFLFRKRMGKGATLAMLLLLLAAAPLLTGCGSGSITSKSCSSTSTPAGTYYFRVTATDTTSPAGSPIVSTVFEVVVQSSI